MLRDTVIGQGGNAIAVKQEWNGFMLRQGKDLIFVGNDQIAELSIAITYSKERKLP